MMILASSFNSVLHQISHQLYATFSYMEQVDYHHTHSHDGHFHHYQHSHPVLDFFKKLSEQSDTPAGLSDLKIAHLTLHIQQKTNTPTVLDFHLKSYFTDFKTSLLEGYSGTTTPPPQV